MKIAASGVFLAALVLLAFQNCNQSAFQSSFNEVNNVSGLVEKLNLGNLQYGAVQVYARGSKIIDQSGQQFQVNLNELFEVNLDTGEVIKSNDYDNVVGLYCMPAERLAQLKSLLNAAEFCRMTKEIPAGTVCAQVYKLPYARLLTSGQDIDLGAATDSCESSIIDLCNGSKAPFVDFLKLLQSEYNNYACQ